MKIIKSFIRKIRFTIVPIDEFTWKAKYIQDNNLSSNNKGCWKIARIAFTEYLKGK